MNIKLPSRGVLTARTSPKKVNTKTYAEIARLAIEDATVDELKTRTYAQIAERAVEYSINLKS